MFWGSQANVGEPTVLQRALQRCRRAFMVLAIFSSFYNVLLLASPLYMLQVYDRVLTSRSLETLLYLTLIALFVLIATAVFDFVRTRVGQHIGMWFERALSGEILERSVRGAVHGHRYGIEKLRDVGTVRNVLGGGSAFALMDIIWMPFFLAIIFLAHWALGAVAVISMVIVSGLAIANEILTREPNRNANAATNRSMQRAADTTRGAETVEAMGMFPGLYRLWTRELDQAQKTSDAAMTMNAGFLAVSRFMRQAVQVAMLGVGAYLVVRQEMSPGGMIAATLIVGRALQPLEMLVGQWRQILNARLAYQRLGQMLAEPLARDQTVELPDPKGSLTVDRLTYVPRGQQRMVIKSVTFELPAAQSLAVIGPSGAGKSTLARLLVGVLAPTAGSVRLDAANLQDWDPYQRGKHVGYLPQEVELFDGTIRDNIARMGEGSDQDVIAAAKLADVHDLILHLPQGYMTKYGEGGVQLSAGQKQRIALARALYGMPKLVVMDEPNSALDLEGEMALVRAMQAMKAAGVTVVIITHRPRVVSGVDKMLVLRNGAVDMFGAAKTVMERMRIADATDRPAALPPADGSAAPRAREVR